jgi:hypothetical protein
MKRFAVPILAAILIISSCRSSTTVNAMMLPAVCDSIPPKLAPSEPRGPQIPAIIKTRDGYGAIVGSVTDSISAQRLQSAGLSLFKLDSSASKSQFGREIPSDPSGGFAFDSVPPGSYVVRVRRIGYNAVQRQVNAVAGKIDTVNFRLRYYICHGY